MGKNKMFLPPPVEMTTFELHQILNSLSESMYGGKTTSTNIFRKKSKEYVLSHVACSHRAILGNMFCVG